MARLATATALVACLAAIAVPSAALANGRSESLRARASHELYNLDREAALADFRAAVAADPQDAAAYRGLASALWLSITFRRGNMTVDDYLGKVTRSNMKMAPPPADSAKAFNDALGRAMAIARAQIDANDKDADAHYQLGAAVGLQASYTATVEGSLLGAFRAAREAYGEHQRVLDLDPSRRDAGLIVGTYRYVVSAVALPMRLMAYMAGFGGDKQKGLRLIEDAASYGGDNQPDARFALVLLYNRELRYDDALKQLAILREQYPKNRLAWLESGSTCLRAGRPADAERFIDEGIARFGDDTRQRMFGEPALWIYKRAMARAGVGKSALAEQDFHLAVSSEGRNWVHGRAHIELGKVALRNGNRAVAQAEIQQGISLCESDNDAATADEARRLLR